MKNNKWIYVFPILVLLFCPGVAIPSPVLEIVSPFEQHFTYLTDFNEMEFTGYGDVTAHYSYTGLGTLNDFSGFAPGNIALILRGTSTFEEKVLNAQAAGASGVLIFNNVPGLTGGTLLHQMDIPVFFLTASAGLDFLNLSSDNPLVHMSNVPEPSTMLLLGSGLVGLVGYGRRRFKK